MDGRERSIAASGQAGVGGGIASGAGGTGGGGDGGGVDPVAVAQIANELNQQRIAAEQAKAQAEQAAQAREMSSVVGGMLPAVSGFTPQDMQTIANRARFGGNLMGFTSLFGQRPMTSSFANAQTLMQMPRASMVDGYLSAPVAAGGAFGTPANLSQGRFGQITYTGTQDPNYTGAFANLVNPAVEMDRAQDALVDTVIDPVTGQERCPDGYEFDANLNACRKITPTEFAPVSVSPVPDGRYARMGLLDQPPTGLLEAGFGSPADFTGANMAFRRQSAPMSSYFTDPRSYEGYTLI